VRHAAVVSFRKSWPPCRFTRFDQSGRARGRAGRPSHLLSPPNSFLPSYTASNWRLGAARSFYQPETQSGRLPAFAMLTDMKAGEIPRSPPFAHLQWSSRHVSPISRCPSASVWSHLRPRRAADLSPGRHRPVPDPMCWILARRLSAPRRWRTPESIPSSSDCRSPKVAPAVRTSASASTTTPGSSCWRTPRRRTTSSSVHRVRGPGDGPLRLAATQPRQKPRLSRPPQRRAP
jgi:hypothetical protein